jgi:hypothetical protein
MVKLRPGTSLAVGFLVLGGFAAACSSDDGGSDDNNNNTSTGGTIAATGGLGGAGTGASTSTGSVSGTGATVGTGGTASSACDAYATVGGTETLIDDFEDEDGMIAEVDGRSGSWYVFNDKSLGATQKPATDVTMSVDGTGILADNAHEGGFGFRSTAEKFTQFYGAGFGFSLNSHGTNACVADSSAFDGITFFIKGPKQVGGVDQAVSLKVQMLDVVPTERGGTCVGDGQCDNSHAYIIPIAKFTGDWEQVTVAWADLHQDPNWGLQIPFDPARIVAIQWTVPKGVGAYDVSVDDVAFTGGNGSGQGGAGGAN